MKQKFDNKWLFTIAEKGKTKTTMAEITSELDEFKLEQEGIFFSGKATHHGNHPSSRDVIVSAALENFESRFDDFFKQVLEINHSYWT